MLDCFIWGWAVFQISDLSYLNLNCNYNIRNSVYHKINVYSTNYYCCVFYYYCDSPFFKNLHYTKPHYTIDKFSARKAFLGP